VIVALVSGLGPPAALAQLTAGSIEGVVRDESGGAVAAASIEVRNVDTGVHRVLLTNSAGRFEAPNLPVGMYEVAASLAGFGTAVRKGIALAVGRTAVVDLTLAVAARREETIVTADASLVETTTATVSNLIDERTVQDLPVANRDLTQLLFLQPGVLKSPAGASVFAGMGDKLAVAGARGTQNLYLIDGVSNSDLSGNAQSASGSYSGAETIKEIQIVTNNYSAEYRSAAGAIVSAITKSGTNTVHGSLFEFYRGDALNAPNYFDKKFGVPKPDLKHHQFGGSIGGPIKPNKLFFFASYEGLREDLGRTATANVPSAAARQGRLANGRTVTVNPAAAKILDLLPVPGQGNQIVQVSGDAALIAGTRNQNTKTNFAVAKLDYSLNGSNTLSATYNFDKGERTPSGLLVDFAAATATRSRKHVVSTKWTSIFSGAAVNEVHFGFSDTRPEGDVPATTVDFASQGLVFRTNRTLMGQINIPGVDSVGFRQDFSAYRQRSYTAKEGFTLSKGSHSVRLGGEWTYYRYNVGNCSRGCQGVFDFSNMEGFLRGVPRRFEIMLPGGDIANRDLHQHYLAGYLQDNWRATSHLTFNLGLRYEFASTIEEKDNQVSNLIDFMDAAVTVGTLYRNPTGKSFSPRLGFVWAPGDGETSLRGGFGIFYEHPTLFNIRTSLQELPPFTLVGRIDQRDANRVGQEINFPNAFSTQLNLARGRPNIRTFQYDLDQTNIYRWSLTFQRQFWTDWVATADYTGSRGRHLWTQSLPNINKWQGWPAPPASSTEKFFPAGSGPINPNFGEVRIQYSNGNLFYHGGSIGIQRRPRAGLQFGLAFTYSKAVDDGSGVTSGGEEFPQEFRGIYAWDTSLKRGLSAYDSRKALTANFAYELPWGRGLTGAAAVLAKGWQINGVFTYMDGYPLSVEELSDAQVARIGDDENLRPDLVPGGNNNPVTGNPDRWYDISQFTPARIGFFGNLGRNTVISPNLATVDLSVFKNIGVRVGRLQFRVETFNLFNRANFGTPDMNAFINEQPNPNAGRITATRTPARRTQLGLRWVF
jgi:outer membrane receptor protein involved in Fe transport